MTYWIDGGSVAYSSGVIIFFLPSDKLLCLVCCDR